MLELCRKKQVLTSPERRLLQINGPSTGLFDVELWRSDDDARTRFLCRKISPWGQGFWDVQVGASLAPSRTSTYILTVETVAGSWGHVLDPSHQSRRQYNGSSTDEEERHSVG